MNKKLNLWFMKNQHLVFPSSTNVTKRNEEIFMGFKCPGFIIAEEDKDQPFDPGKKAIRVISGRAMYAHDIKDYYPEEYKDIKQKYDPTSSTRFIVLSDAGDKNCHPVIPFEEGDYPVSPEYLQETLSYLTMPNNGENEQTIEERIAKLLDNKWVSRLEFAFINSSNQLVDGKYYSLFQDYLKAFSSIPEEAIGFYLISDKSKCGMESDGDNEKVLFRVVSEGRMMHQEEIMEKGNDARNELNALRINSYVSQSEDMLVVPTTKDGTTSYKVFPPVPHTLFANKKDWMHIMDELAKSINTYSRQADYSDTVNKFVKELKAKEQ